MSKKYFYCVSCQRERPTDQLAKIIPSNKSRRCTTCVNNANAAKRLIVRVTIP